MAKFKISLTQMGGFSGLEGTSGLTIETPTEQAANDRLKKLLKISSTLNDTQLDELHDIANKKPQWASKALSYKGFL